MLSSTALNKVHEANYREDRLEAVDLFLKIYVRRRSPMEREDVSVTMKTAQRNCKQIQSY